MKTYLREFEMAFKKCKHYIQKIQNVVKTEDFETYILYFHNFGYRVSTSFKKDRNRKGVALFGGKNIPFSSVSQSVSELPVILAKKPCSGLLLIPLTQKLQAGPGNFHF